MFVHSNHIERIKRLKRLFYLKTWRALALFLTEPSHDEYFRRFRKVNTSKYISDPEPWFTLPAVSFLTDNLKSDMNVFEWGAGSSTLWFAMKVNHVVSIEHDKDWYEVLKGVAPENVELVNAPIESDRYIDSIDTVGECKVFVIDGRRRVECAEKVLELLDKGRIPQGALIIFDDAHRERYSAAVQLLVNRASQSMFYEGLSNTVIAKTTAIFCI